ncbi:hypothetical protein HOD30_02370 [Candidatus Peregrinibacteria bacterium]|jgi:hypothetical protein|nr:hypothetical protein [Candidatus Peregrinibacteria bacterium]MBT4631844.1 hypothetical protein [Candidatus Peregrinibacteria bacterium]MBT5824431.1 hypothetical protein [Candidatus Peregrinibacteria bacterium]
MNKNSQRGFAQTIGAVFAIIQGMFDIIFDYFFKLMKKASKEKKADTEGLKFFKKIGGFIGELGQSYYETYEEIKRRKK